MTEAENGQHTEPPVEGQTPPFSSGYESDEAGGVQQPERSQDARNMAMLCHILGILGFIAPLIIWLTERDRHRFVDEHGRDAMNYQISFMLYLIALCITIIGSFLVPVLMIVHVVLSIMGALKAYQGQPWHYPIALKFLK